MRPWATIRLSRRLTLLAEPRDLWCGVFWDRDRDGRLLLYVGGPLLVLRVEVSR